VVPQDEVPLKLANNEVLTQTRAGAFYERRLRRLKTAKFDEHGEICGYHLVDPPGGLQPLGKFSLVESKCDLPDDAESCREGLREIEGKVREEFGYALHFGGKRRRGSESDSGDSGEESDDYESIDELTGSK